MSRKNALLKHTPRCGNRVGNTGNRCVLPKGHNVRYFSGRNLLSEGPETVWLTVPNPKSPCYCAPKMRAPVIGE